MKNQSKITYTIKRNKITNKKEVREINYNFVNGERVTIEMQDLLEEWQAGIVEMKKLDNNEEQRERRRINNFLEIKKKKKLLTEREIILLPNDEYNKARQEQYAQCIFQNIEVVEESSSIEADVMLKLRYEQLHKAIMRLLPEQQELIIAIHFHQIPATEIAKRDGVSKSAISHRLERIYKKLREELTA